MSYDLYQSWSHRWVGVATLTFSDGSGGPWPITTPSTLQASHLALDSVATWRRDAPSVDLGYPTFASWLQTELNASPSARTYTVAFVAEALAYVITVNAGSFTMAFAGTTGATMRRVLGFHAGVGWSGSWSSSMRPWYVNRPVVTARSNYRPPVVSDGQIRIARTDGGRPYGLSPASLRRASKWEHWYEPEAAMRREGATADTVAGSASWTWEDAFEHASRYGDPCIAGKGIGAPRDVFYLSSPMTEGSTRLAQKSNLSQQIVSIVADPLVGTIA